MVEALLRHHLGRAGADVTVTSAGTRGANLPVDPAAVNALSAMGVDLSGHVARVVTRQVVDTEGADLVITMTRDHLRTVSTMGRNVFHRTFTLPELVRLATDAGRQLPDDLSGWVRAVGDGRRPSEMMTTDPADDVADPYGMGQTEVKRTAAQLDLLAQSLAMLAPWPHR